MKDHAKLVALMLLPSVKAAVKAFDVAQKTAALLGTHTVHATFEKGEMVICPVKQREMFRGFTSGGVIEGMGFGDSVEIMLPHGCESLMNRKQVYKLLEAVGKTPKTPRKSMSFKALKKRVLK